MNFVKMHGIGNDYVYIDCFKEQVAAPRELAIQISDRHFGVGGDGLVLIMPSVRRTRGCVFLTPTAARLKCAAMLFVVSVNTSMMNDW